MCGIAGIIGAPKAQDRLRAMMAMLQHRGPDEAGLYFDHQAALGHTRLSIIDLSSGTQPIHNEDETLWIVFNGEIFNYPELRMKLLSRGHRFYTTTDTETILHLYEDKGTSCLNDLNGQFAFAIWDSRNMTCFLARDRVGIRPLYYTQCGAELIFASEIKSIFMNPKVPREIDPLALEQVFTTWAPLPGRTPFEGIRELPAGHSLVFSAGHSRVSRYWQAPFMPREEQLDWSPGRISEEIRILLREATRIRLRADVPVGTYLSGGLDSSGLTALVARHFNQDVQTFGIRFEDAIFDESEYQRNMVSYLGVNHTELPVSNEQIGAALPRAVWHAEKPLLRTAPVPLLLLAEIVRRANLKVVLTGEGSDEVFGGYNIFREALVRRFWARSPESKRRSDLIPALYPYLFRNAKHSPMLKAFFARGLMQTDDLLYSHRLRWANTSRIKAYFSGDLKSNIGTYSVYDDIRDQLPPAFNSWDHLAQAQYIEMNIFMSNYLLSSQGDRMAMGHSVEMRMPYLDPNVMQFMGRVPATWKILGLKEKYILKKSFEGTLPQRIIQRPKQPYRAPVSNCLLTQGLKDHRQEMLSAHRLRESGLFDPCKVDRLVRKVSSGQGGEVDDMALAGILTTQMLHDRFITHFDRSDLSAVAPSLVIDRRSGTLENIQQGALKHEHPEILLD